MTDYNKWKVTDLKSELKKRGLLQTGVKSLLVARLEEAESKEGFESEATIQSDSIKLDAPSTTANSPDTVSPALPTETLPDALTPTDSTVTELPHLDTSTNHNAVESSSNTPKEYESQPNDSITEPLKSDHTTDAQPNDATDAQPNDATDAQPNDATDAQPNGATDAQPNEDIDAQSVKVTDVQSSEATNLQPSEVTDVQSSETTDAQSSELTGAQSSEATDALPSELQSTEETREDRQKRKRSSQSPASPVTETFPKRLRTGEDFPANDSSEEREAKDKLQDDNTEERSNLDSETKKIISPNSNHLEIEADSKEKFLGETAKEEEAVTENSNDAMKIDPPEKQEKSATSESNEVPSEVSTSTRRDSRFKGLFNGGDNQNEVESAHDDPKPERSVSPAIHPATSALYIRDMQRPLSPQQFRYHLSALAAPPGHDPDPDLILSFYLDPIRTHAFISFTSVCAASRVRTALHSRVWPDERNRKPLWVDFVPEEKLEDWITQEQESNTGGRSMAKKWEVYYEIGEDRQITASLQEASNVPLPAQHQASTTSQQSSNLIPLGPRSGIDGAPSGPRAHFSRTQLVPVDIGGSKLNELFNSTITKPVLYWKPVSRDLANKRLDRIEDSYSSEVKAGGRVMGDPHRYTFEEGDMLVDRGVELVPGLRPPPGYRAPRPGGDRGGFSAGGGWGRGGGGIYRGRGGGGYRGMANDKFGYGNDSRSTRDSGRY